MAQVTIYMDNNLEAQIKELAKNAGVSISKFISKVLEQKIAPSWSDDVKKLVGSWDDIAPLEEIKNFQTNDIKREEF